MKESLKTITLETVGDKYIVTTTIRDGKYTTKSTGEYGAEVLNIPLGELLINKED